MNIENGENLNSYIYHDQKRGLSIEVPDRYLLDSDPVEIASQVAPDTTKANILAGFIARQQEKWRQVVKAEKSEKNDSFRRVIIKNIRHILENPEFYYDYKD